MTIPAPADVVRALYAAFGRNDGAGIVATLDPTTVWTHHAPASHPYGGTFRGIDGVTAFLGAIAAHVEMLDFGPDEFVAQGELVTVTGHETLRARATGRTLTHRWIHLFEVRAGKIVRFEEWADSAKGLELFRR